MDLSGYITQGMDLMVGEAGHYIYQMAFSSGGIIFGCIILAMFFWLITLLSFQNNKNMWIKIIEKTDKPIKFRRKRKK